MDDTIVAISTATGVSAINIIRLSGSKAIEIVDTVFDKDLKTKKSNTITYGHIVFNGEVIDEVLVSVFRAPKSYTTEDIVEINCHGGIAPTNKILETILMQGARLAEPGEFIKRAYLNGRVDLIEAESVQDLIYSKTEASRKMSINGVNGILSKLIKKLRNDILAIIANIEVNIDYPEYEDAIEITNEILKEKISVIKSNIINLIKESENGKIIKNGIEIGIIGRPNVGKSSLLNEILQENKAIVTDIEGTTRDIVEGSIILNGIELKFIDTAGIRNTKNLVEKIGVEKSKEIIEKSDLILMMFDNNKTLSEEEKQLIKETRDKKRIFIINKIDLKTNIDKNYFPKTYPLIEMTVKDYKYINTLKEEIINMFNLKELEISDYTYISNSRQIALLKECLIIVNTIQETNENGISVDLIEIDLKRLWDKLGEIIGESYKDELLDEIFSKFCLGK